MAKLMMMMMMMNCFCGMVDRQKAFSLISSWDHCQRSSPSRISDMPWAGSEPAQNLSSGLVEWSCAVVLVYATLVPHFNEHVLVSERDMALIKSIYNIRYNYIFKQTCSGKNFNLIVWFVAFILYSYKIQIFHQLMKGLGYVLKLKAQYNQSYQYAEKDLLLWKRLTYITTMKINILRFWYQQIVLNDSSF